MNRFCFVIHPTSLADVVRYEPGAHGKGAPIIRKILEWMPPYAACKVTGVRAPDGREIEGWFVAAPLLPEQMLELPRESVFERILGAIRIGHELGARIAGLGAFSGIVGDGGVTIAERAPIPVTTGNSLTIAAGARSLLRGASAMGCDPATSTLAVIGATGSIGAACVALLAPHVARLILVAPNLTRLNAMRAGLAPEIAAKSECATEIHTAVRNADLVLTATSATREIIEPDDLRPGAVVCELSLPHNIGSRISEMRPDVLVVEGGMMRMPGEPVWDRVREPGRAFELGLGEGMALACMSETMVLTMEGRFESYTLGRGVSLERVREIEGLADKCGFTLGDMRAFDLPISAAQITEKRRAAQALRERLHE
jgi:fatty aldehyde-generating acyl-ACP reductase